VSLPVFGKQPKQNFYHEKSSHKTFATSVIKKLLKVNNYPIGENSPNLVTLLCSQTPKIPSPLLHFRAATLATLFGADSAKYYKPHKNLVLLNPLDY
jgi:hypothetical protein